jgi:hypothetical protein
MAVDAMRADRLEDRPQEPVIELPLTAITGQAQPDRRVHIAAHGLAVHASQPLHGPDAFPA